MASCDSLGEMTKLVPSSLGSSCLICRQQDVGTAGYIDGKPTDIGGHTHRQHSQACAARQVTVPVLLRQDIHVSKQPGSAETLSVATTNACIIANLSITGLLIIIIIICFFLLLHSLSPWALGCPLALLFILLARVFARLLAGAGTRSLLRGCLPTSCTGRAGCCGRTGLSRGQLVTYKEVAGVAAWGEDQCCGRGCLIFGRYENITLGWSC